MEASSSAYLAGAGLITAIGGDVNANYHAVRAGISGYQRANYLSSNHSNITLAQVPEAALAPIIPTLARRGATSFYERKTLGLCHIAATQAMGKYPNTAPLPLLFASPSYSLAPL